jgi:hypothetical protein
MRGRRGFFTIGTLRGARRPALLLTCAVLWSLVSAAGAQAQAPCGATGVFSTSGTMSSCTYTTAGEDTFSVPGGVGTFSVVAVGANGGPGGASSTGRAGGAGGQGAQVTASVSPAASPLYVEVGANGAAGTSGPGSGNTCPAGAGGTNGGGAGGDARCQLGGGGGGGGASDVRTTPSSGGGLTGQPGDPRLVVAGGGGGGAGASFAAAGAPGGSAGVGSVGGAGNGGDTSCAASGVQGGPGGAGGVGAGGGAGGGDPTNSCSFVFPVAVGGAGGPAGGGTGGNGDRVNSTGPGGGGGGYIGGGGGASAADVAGGGGGGSSLGPAGASVATASAPPQVVISWIGKVATKLVAAPAKRSLLSIMFSATLTRVSDAAPVAGRTIVFKVAGQTICSATTSSAGKVSCTVNAIVIGSGSYSASFAGDGTYLPSSATAPL